MNVMRGTVRGTGGRGNPSFSSRGRRTSEDPHAGASRHANASTSQPVATTSASRPKSNQKKPPRPRPTHFIAIPLNTNPAILNRISAFQNALLEYSNPRQGTEKNRIRGLDPSIIIDPRRFHFTLGVMALEEPAPAQDEEARVSGDAAPTTMGDTNPPSPVPPPQPAKTVESALALLRSLKPALAEIISGPVASNGAPLPEPLQAPASAPPLPPLRIVLDKVDIMDPVAPPKVKTKGKCEAGRGGAAVEGVEHGGQEEVVGAVGRDNALRKEVSDAVTDGGSGVEEIWTKVLYVAPSLAGVQGEKLRRVSDLVYRKFKQAGYLTDTRALKLHCTVLNTSKRRPSRLRGDPFSYTDVLKSGATNLLLSKTTTPPSNSAAVDTSATIVPPKGPVAGTQRGSTTVPASSSNSMRKVAPPPVLINLGDEVGVGEIALWIMGSRGPNNEYVSCGGVGLG